MQFQSFPFVIGLELTLACNLRCKHCASSAGQSRSNELSLKELIDILNQFPYLLVQEVDLTGGEPLLHPFWDKIALHLNNLNIPVRMVSNGILLEKNILKIRDAGIQTIGISIDGLEKTHDYIRKKSGLFKTIVKSIEHSLKFDIPIAAITAVNQYNINELPALLKFLKKIGIKYWQVQPTFSLGRASDDKLEIAKNTFIELGKFIKNHKIDSHNDIELLPADGVGYFSKLDTREKNWSGCGAGKTSCGITSDGKVKGCLSMPDSFIEGDLREKDLWSIWFDENSFKYNRNFCVNDLGELCQDCQHGLECKGGCSVMSFSSTNKLHNDPLCFHNILTNTSQYRKQVSSK